MQFVYASNVNNNGTTKQIKTVNSVQQCDVICIMFAWPKITLSVIILPLG